MTGAITFPKTEYGDLEKVNIKSAHLMHVGRLGVKAHAALVFVTDQGRVIISRAGPEIEPTAAHFGKVLWPSLVKRFRLLQSFGLAKVEATYDFGRLKHFTGPLKPVQHRNAKTRSPEEDEKTHHLDIVNFHSVIQGFGINGLFKRPNVQIDRITAEPQEAQTLFKAALKINAMMDKAHFAYDVVPDPQGTTGINGHTVIALIAEEADRMNNNTTNYLSLFSRLGIFPGASTSRNVLGIRTAGPNLQDVELLTLDSMASLPCRNPGPRKPIPLEQRMPYSRKTL